MDHRWGQRHPTDVEVQFVAKQGTTGTGRILNISLTGAYLKTRVPLRVHSLVYLEPAALSSGSDHGRRIAASVVRQDALGVGLEWCESTSEKTNPCERLAVLLGSASDKDNSHIDRGFSTAPIKRRRHILDNPA
jgi:hypothetical protein